MKLRFWGTRGSLPVALTAPDVLNKVAQALHAAGGRKFESLAEARGYAETLPFAIGQTYGGHTSCVEIELAPPAPGPNSPAHEYIVCDLGSGVRPFGSAVLQRHGPATGNTFHIFMSHVHWDHIMGFPFFAPAYIRGNTLKLYGCHAELEHALRRQQDPPSFPVGFEGLGANIEFIRLEPGRDYELAGMTVRAMKQLHAGDSYGWRFTHEGRSAVYSTDSEHKVDDPRQTDQFIEFFREADAVVFDAMYSLADAISVKQDWGHSSNMMGVELCQEARAGTLILFHHEPIHADARLAAIQDETRRLATLTAGGGPVLKVITAYDGLEFEV